jgi:hypothetical protein
MSSYSLINYESNSVSQPSINGTLSAKFYGGYLDNLSLDQIIIAEGQVFDKVTGLPLFDEITGLPIVI